MTEMAETTVRSGETDCESPGRAGTWPGAASARSSWSSCCSLFPYIVYPGTTGIMVQALHRAHARLACGTCWPGTPGLVSVGQQAFFGLGAYFVLIPAMHGTSPCAGAAHRGDRRGVAALPLWWLVSRLRSGYFAIATWVLAAAIMLVIEQFSSIGGGTGVPLPGLTGIDPAVLAAYTYWAALAVAVLALGAMYFLLRCRVGLVLTAIRDDERAARTSGVRVGLARLLVFVVAAAGCGAAGGRARDQPAPGAARARCSACSGPPRWRSR